MICAGPDLRPRGPPTSGRSGPESPRHGDEPQLEDFRMRVHVSQGIVAVFRLPRPMLRLIHGLRTAPVRKQPELCQYHRTASAGRVTDVVRTGMVVGRADQSIDQLRIDEWAVEPHSDAGQLAVS